MLFCLQSAAILQIEICFCRGLNDKHIWISVVGRPSLSTFSRMQRVACCLSLILGYLLTNMMFFHVTVTDDQKNKKIGVFTLPWAQLAIGIFQFQYFICKLCQPIDLARFCNWLGAHVVARVCGFEPFLS